MIRTTGLLGRLGFLGVLTLLIVLTVPGVAAAQENASSGSGTGTVFTIVVVAVLAVGAVVAFPLIRARSQEQEFTTTQAWLKAATIFLYFVLATMILPSRVVEAGFLSTAPSFLEDALSTEQWDVVRSLIGSGVWMVALGLGIWGLRRLQRGKVI
jgi:hypothetical protein